MWDEITKVETNPLPPINDGRAWEELRRRDREARGRKRT